MNWQPIETAPKDGTSVIAWNGYVVTEASFVARKDDDGRAGWCEAGFTTGGILPIINNIMDPPPILYQPMPEPPK